MDKINEFAERAGDVIAADVLARQASWKSVTNPITRTTVAPRRRGCARVRRLYRTHGREFAAPMVEALVEMGMRRRVAKKRVRRWLDARVRRTVRDAGRHDRCTVLVQVRCVWTNFLGYLATAPTSEP